MGLPVAPRLLTLTRGSFAAGLGLLAVYLFFAYLSYFLDVLGWFDVALLARPDAVAPWVAAAAGLAMGLAVSLPRSRPEAAEPVEAAGEALVRYSLIFIFPLYAVTKFLRIQFRLPFVVLDAPLGDVAGIALTWRFFGYSYPYEFFVGLGELAGAVLLLFRRTTTLGACLLLPIAANVAFVNYTHGIPVKLYSSCLLVMVCWLVALDFPRLSALFLLNRPFGARQYPELPLPSRLRRAVPYLKGGFLAFALAHAFVYLLLADSKPSPVTGGWKVTRAEFTGRSKDGGKGEWLAWRKVFFERDMRGVFVGSVKTEEGSKPNRFRYEVGPEEGRLQVTFTDASFSPAFDGTYEFLDGGTLRLNGKLGERAVEVVLARER
jgi:hypothetical protein